MDSLGGFDWEQSGPQDEIFHANKISGPSGQLYNAPSGLTFTFPQPNFASRSCHSVHQLTEQDRSGCTCPPKDHGNCLAGEGGITMQEADISGAVGDALNVGVSCSAQAQHIEDGVIQEKSKAPTDDTSEQRKRFRSPNWSDKETKGLLKLKLELFMRANSRGKPVESRQWSKEVSKLLLETYGSDRSFTSCSQRWDTMLRIFNAICVHDAKIHLDGSNGVRFWEMSEDQRSKYVKMKFLWKWYVLIKNIILVEADMNDSVKKNLRKRRRTRSTEVDANIASTSTQYASTAKDPSSSQGQVSTLQPMASFVPSTQGRSQQHHDEVFKAVPNAAVDENDLIAKIAPIVSKQIEAALEPLKSALRLVLANPMGNAVPYGAQTGVVDFNVDTSLEHGHGLEDFSDMIFEDGTNI